MEIDGKEQSFSSCKNISFIVSKMWGIGGALLAVFRISFTASHT